MSEMTTTPQDELAKCKSRTRKLAMEKSYLQLVNDLMMRLSEVTGVETVVETLLTLLLDNLGGSNVTVYYGQDSDLCYTDVYGRHGTIESIDDEIVERAFASREFIEVEHDFEQTKMMTPNFTKASTWAAPLMVGSELVGVLKLEDMLMTAQEIRGQLEPFLRYAALTLKNEISGYAKIKKAYDELSETNAKLSAEIEQRQATEAALLQEREFVRSLLESMADGVVACDANGTLTLFNRAAREWHGMDPQRLPPEEWAKHYDLFRADGVTPLSTEEVPLARAFNGGIVVDAGMAIVAKGRAPRFILANGSMIRGAAGEKLGAVVVMRDVTALRHVEEKLRTANEELEQRIAARTAELKTANEQLWSELAERKLAVLALKKSEERFRRLAENASDVIYRMSLPDGSYEYMSPAATDLFGYTPEDFYGAPQLLRTVIHPDWHRYLEEQWTRLLQGDMPPTYEYQIVHKSGEVRWVNQRNILIRDNTGRIIAIEGIATDISERKKVEKDLQEREAMYRNLFECVPDAILIADLETGILCDANPSAAALLGRPRNELIGRHQSELHPAGIAAQTKALFQEHAQAARSGKISGPCEHLLLRADGTEIPVEIMTQPVVINGKLMIQGVFRDITERLKSEAETRRSAREWLAAMDASEDVIYLLDLERRVMRANKAFFMMTKSTPQTAIGKHILELLHPGDKQVPCPICFAQEEKRDAVFVMEPDHPHNPVGRPFEITLRIVRDDEGQPMSMFITLHDLTREREVQAELTKYREHLEELVETRTAEIEEKNAELERVNKLFVGRELRMIELKERIKELEARS